MRRKFMILSKRCSTREQLTLLAVFEANRIQIDSVMVYITRDDLDQEWTRNGWRNELEKEENPIWLGLRRRVKSIGLQAD